MTTTSRRHFLGLSASALGAALVAACSGDDAAGPASTIPTSTTLPEDAWPPDVALAQTAISIELATRRIHDDLVATGLLVTERVAAAISAFRAQHDPRRELWTPVVTEAAIEPIEDPNALILAVLQPRLTTVATETDAVVIAADVAQLVAQIHVWMATQFTTAELRARAGAVAGAVQRQHALLATELGLDPFGDNGAFVPAENPAPTAVIRG